MSVYFDYREGREKLLPDCSCAGLVWDERTQRCEITDWTMTSFDSQAGQWFFDANEFGDGYDLDGAWEWGEEHTGLGFLPAVAVAAPVIWPGIAAIGAAIGGFFARMFGGGGDDQATQYRPPVDTAQQFVQFDDPHGAEVVAYELSPESLAEAARRGNRWEDIFSYYSAFISGNTQSGASPAARRVIEDAARKHGISISRAADWLLNTAGIRRIAQAFLPSGQGATAPQPLPPYCPVGTYHPYPLGHPQQDVCEPFPPPDRDAEPRRQRQSQTGASRQRQRGGSRSGTWVNPQTGQVEQLPQCSTPGTVFNPETGQCEPGSAGSSLFDSFGDSFPWWLLLLLAGVLVATSGGDDEPADRDRRRRR